MPNTSGLVLADDATGALECASLLAGLNLHVSLVIDETLRPGIQVVDTESRHLPPDEAAARIRQWLAHNPGSVFKKTDSTLRGNIAAELLAMLSTRPIVYIPAYPAVGRTVIDGQLFVHGRRTSRIAEVFPANSPIEAIQDAAGLAAALSNPTPRILICDAASNADLDQLAAVLGPSTWLAGPAGFIPYWAALNTFLSGHPPSLPKPEKWLIVCGSRHPQSRRQANYAEVVGLPVLRTSDEDQDDPEQVAANLARDAIRRLEIENPDAILIMGGDTVWAIWRSLGITEIEPLPEILPGIAACLSPERNLLFVTKAGAFGDDRLVETVLERCNRT